MSRSSRRPGLRRVPRERSQPAPRRPFFVAAPPEKRLGRLVLTLVFFIAVVALILSGTPPLTIRAGQKALRDYPARATFEIEDLESTRRAREDAERQVLRTYDDQSDQLATLKTEVENFLAKVAAAPADQLPEDEAKTIWGLTPEDLQTLQQGLTPERLNAIDGRLESLFKELAETKLWTEETQKEEWSSNREYIFVAPPGASEPHELSVWTPIRLPAQLDARVSRAVSVVVPTGDFSAFGDALVKLLMQRLRPTLVLDVARTQADVARAGRSVPPQIKEIPVGATILRSGEVATEQAVRELTREAEVYEREATPSVAMRAREAGATALAVAILFVILGLYIGRSRADLMRSNSRFFYFGLVGFVVLLCGKLILLLGLPLTLTPLCAASLIYSIVCGRGFALGMTAFLGVLLGFTLDRNFESIAVLMVGGAAAAAVFGGLRRRTELVGVGLAAGLLQGLMVWAFWWMSHEEALPLREAALTASAAGLACGVIVGFGLTVLLPVVESLFGVVTDVTMLEWADQNQPLLRKLAIEAPGTYHHCMIVSSLSEAAAETIGANPFLVRAGALLHDIGKLNKPEYFAENVPGDPGKRHHDLSPQMSALVITAHVKDGVEIAEHYKVPQAICDIIQQHHGVTLVEFFYSRALEAAGNESVEQDTFRYRGPRPQTREAGIILIADAVESATRSLGEPSPARIEKMVEEISRRRLLDGQLDESGLTLTDLRQATRSFSRTLLAVFHPRVEYPEQRAR